MVFNTLAEALPSSILFGVLFALIVSIRYLIKIEQSQKKTLVKLTHLEEIISATERRILKRLPAKRK